jgi:hypothetical protein
MAGTFAVRRNAWKHGYARTPTYRSWLAMRNRCKRPNFKFFAYYGGRGIKVCEKWEKSFQAFLADMWVRGQPDWRS